MTDVSIDIAAAVWRQVGEELERMGLPSGLIVQLPTSVLAAIAILDDDGKRRVAARCKLEMEYGPLEPVAG